MHGAIVASSEALSKSIPTTRNELQTLFAKLNVLYKERNTMVEGCYQRAQECGMSYFCSFFYAVSSSWCYVLCGPACAPGPLVHTLILPIL